MNVPRAIRAFIEDPAQPAHGASFKLVLNAADQRLYRSTSGPWRAEECDAVRAAV